MADQIKTLTDQLKQHNYAGVLQTIVQVPEAQKTDDLKLLELVARLKADPNSPMINHYMNESSGWVYEQPDKLLSERAFIHLLHQESSPAIRLYQQLGEDNFTALDFNRYGNAHLINHDFDQALRCYDKRLNWNPTNPAIATTKVEP